MKEGNRRLADRFLRAELMGGTREPFLWRWRDDHPLALRCARCEEWEPFKRHRDAKRLGWTRRGYDDWLHEECVPEWEKHGAELVNQRVKARDDQAVYDFLFSRPELLDLDEGGWLVRSSQPREQRDAFGIFDDFDQMHLAAEGTERLPQVIDRVPESQRDDLVAIGFSHYSLRSATSEARYRFGLAWIDKVPAGFPDDLEFDDIACQSIAIDELPRQLRRWLPKPKRDRL